MILNKLMQSFVSLRFKPFEFIVAFIAFSFSPATAETFGDLSGRVYNDTDGSGLPGVHIILKDTKMVTITNAQGYFLLNEIPRGKYVILAQSVGFESFSLSVDLSESNMSIKIGLKESSKLLNELTVESISIIDYGGVVEDVPGSTHVLTPKELEKFSSNDVMQILRNIPGVNLQDEDGFGLRPNIGLRGTGVERSSKITVMEDGILIAPAPYVAPAAYYFPTAGRMEGIEIRKGSSQIKYGPYTTGGAINLISTSIPNELMGRIYLFGGSFGKRIVHAFVGTASDQIGFVAETYQVASDGFKQLDNDGNTEFQTGDYLFKFRVNSKESNRIFQALTFSAGKYRERSYETYLGLTDLDFSSTPLRRYSGSQKDVMNADHSKFSVSYLLKPSERISLNTTLYRTDFYRNWYKLDKVRSTDSSNFVDISEILEDPSIYSEEFKIIKGADSPEDAMNVKANNRTYFTQGIQLRASWNDGQQNFIDFGVRLHQDQIDRFQWVDQFQMLGGTMMKTLAGIPGTESNRIEDAYAFASYLQYRFEFRKWKFTPGLRYETISMTRDDYGKNDPKRTGKEMTNRENNVSVWIPGAGISYTISPYWNSFVGIHKGFSPPGTKDGTNPEISVNYEVGLNYSKSVFSFSTVIFYSNYQNLLGVDLASSGGTGSGDLFNGGAVKSVGAETSLHFRYLPFPQSPLSFPFSLAYTYTQAWFLNDFINEYDAWGKVSAGDQLPYLAPNQLVFNAGIEHHKYQFNLSSKFASPMRTVAGQGSLVQTERTDPMFVIDISSQYYISWNVGVFGSIQNVTNNTYIVTRRPSGVRPAIPRNYTLGIKASF